MDKFEDVEKNAADAESIASAWVAQDEHLNTGTEFPHGQFTFQLEPLADIELDTSQQWLIAGLMPSSGLHVLYGAPGTGKSFVALHAALHVAAGRSWAGRSVYQGGVVYVASEGGRNFRKRVVAAKRALGLPDTTPFTLITTTPCLGGPRHQTRELIDDIAKQCAKLDITPKLIVLDTLSRSITDLRESDAQDIMDFVKHAQEIGDAFEALVLPIHHCGKDESRGMRGSSALHGAADAEWLVRKDPDTGARHITVEKMKDGPEQGRVRYDLRDYPLGHDDKKEPIITCVVDVLGADDQAPPSKAPTARGLIQLEIILNAVRMLVAIEGQTIPACEAMPAGAKGINVGRLKDVLVASGIMAGEAAATTVAIGRALKKLGERGVTRREGDLVCIPTTASPQPEGQSQPKS